MSESESTILYIVIWTPLTLLLLIIIAILVAAFFSSRREHENTKKRKSSWVDAVGDFFEAIGNLFD